MANEKKQGYLIYPAPSPRSYDMTPGPQSLTSVPRPSCSGSNHGISGKLKHVACFTCSLLL